MPQPAWVHALRLPALPPHAACCAQLGATAGLRLLGNASADEILEGIRRYLKAEWPQFEVEDRDVSPLRAPCSAGVSPTAAATPRRP